MNLLSLMVSKGFKILAFYCKSRSFQVQDLGMEFYFKWDFYHLSVPKSILMGGGFLMLFLALFVDKVHFACVLVRLNQLFCFFHRLRILTSLVSMLFIIVCCSIFICNKLFRSRDCHASEAQVLKHLVVLCSFLIN